MNTTTLLLFTTVTASLSSCVSYTEYRDEPKINPRFTSIESSKSFYEGHIRKKVHKSSANPGNRKEIGIFFIPANPLEFIYRKRIKNSPSKSINDSLRQADSNGNGVISLAEANKFSQEEPN